MGCADLADLSRMIARIYEGATDAAAWGGILEDLSLWLEAPKAALLTPTVGPEAGGFAYAYGMTQADMERNYRDFPGEDAWVSRCVALGIAQQDGMIVTSEDLMPLAELQETRWHREFLSPLDINHLLSCVLYGTSHPSFPVLACSFYAGEARGPFGLPAKHALAMVLPHLTRATGLMFLLRDADFRVAASLAAMERLDQGIVLVDQAGVLVHANPAAHKMLRAKDGLFLDLAPDRKGWLVAAADRPAHATLALALDEALGGRPETLSRFSRGIRIPRSSGREPYLARVSEVAPLRGVQRDHAPTRAIIFLTDPVVPLIIDEALLESLYGLSRAEARLAGALSLGGTLEEAAWDLGLSLNTAKTELKGVYRKTGARSRAQLAKLAVPLVQPQIPAAPRTLP